MIRLRYIGLGLAILALAGYTSNDGSAKGLKVGGNEVYMAFSGGGYHAQTAAAAWMMGLMDRLGNDDNNLADVTVNVPTIASNSGGSWFLTQAAYSDIYLQSIQTEGAWNTYTTADQGYMGDAWEYIRSLPSCDDLNGWLEKTMCTYVEVKGSSLIKFQLTGGIDWDQLTQDAVFGDKFLTPRFDMATELKDTKLSDARNAWSEKKALIISGTLLTNGPALTKEESGYSVYYVLGSQNGFDTEDLPAATPVIMGAMGDSGQVAPNFIPGGDVALGYGLYPDGASTSTTLSEIQSTQDLGVMHAAAISSAAGAAFINVNVMTEILESVGIDEKWAEAVAIAITLVLDRFAPGYKMTSSPIEYLADVSAIATTLDQLTDQQIVRMGDGGHVDNTAVAYLMRHLQDNDMLTNGFNIVAFDNYPGAPFTGAEVGKPDITYYTAADIARLFGYSDPAAKTHRGCLFDPMCYTSLVPHVFESSAYFDKDTFEPVDPEVNQPYEVDPDVCAIYIRYLKYKVTTVDNDAFGIKAGVEGALHVLVAMSGKTSVVPTSEANMDCYSQMVSGIHDAVTNSDIGASLASALGLE